MKIDRRDFLKTAGGLTALSLGLNAYSPPVFQRRLLAAPTGGPKKLLYLFQRGGMDGINACIPRGDPEYNTTNRPTLYVTENAVQNAYQGISTDLGNGFAQLHPRLWPMMELFNAGQLAVIHRVGYKGQSQSHFDSQQYWENGTLDRNLEVGIFNRLIQENIAKTGNTFPGVSLSSDLMVALRGPEPVPNFSYAPNFKLKGSAAQSGKFLGRKFDGGEVGRGLLGFYSGQRDFAGKPYRDQVYRTGVVLADAMDIVQDRGINPNTYTPANGAQYPGGTFGDRLKQCAQLFKETPVQILGVNLGGWDTHTNQDRSHFNRLYDVARAYRALSQDLADQWDDIVVISMTEFGRTSKENGSFGTDHAYATAVFAGGGSINGGVYNCDSSTWQPGDMFSTSNGRYLAHRTDFRQVLAEIFTDFFGDTVGTVDKVIPNYQTLSTSPDQSQYFQKLGLIAT